MLDHSQAIKFNLDVKRFLQVVGVIAIFIIACSGIPTTIDTINTLEPHLEVYDGPK